jgi:hypothetical protein
LNEAYTSAIQQGERFFAVDILLAPIRNESRIEYYVRGRKVSNFSQIRDQEKKGSKTKEKSLLFPVSK